MSVIATHPIHFFSIIYIYLFSWYTIYCKYFFLLSLYEEKANDCCYMLLMAGCKPLKGLLIKKRKEVSNGFLLPVLCSVPLCAFSMLYVASILWILCCALSIPPHLSLSACPCLLPYVESLER